MLSVVFALCLAGVALLVAAAAQFTGSSIPAVLAETDYDAEMMDVRTSLREVSEGDTADILIEIRNRSSSQNPYGGEATLDLYFTVRQSSGDPDYFGTDDATFTYNQTRTFRIANYTFDSAGTVGIEVGVFDNRGMQSGWSVVHRFSTDSGRLTVNEQEPDFDAEIERIWLSRSVKSGETADINVRVENLARRNGPHSGYGTYDVLLEVEAPSGEDFTIEWNDLVLGYHEEITLAWGDFQFREVGRYRFSAEVHDIRGQQESWDSDHMFDSRSWSYSVEQGEPEWDAEVERIWIDPDVEAGGRADINVRFENRSQKDGPYDGTATFDLLLEWYSPSGRMNSEHWDDIEFDYREDITKVVEDFLFDEAGQWGFQAEIHDNRGAEEGFPPAHMFGDRAWSYNVDDTEPTWDARVNNIRVSASTGAIEVDFQNMSHGEGTFDFYISITSPSGQSVRYEYDDRVFEFNETKTFIPNFTFDESGSYSATAAIADVRGRQENWNTAHQFHTLTRSFRVTIPEDLVDVCPVVTLEGGRNPWLLKVKVDGVEQNLDNRGCVKLAGDTGSGTFGEGEYLLEVIHPGYLPATLLVYLVEGDPVADPELELLLGDVNGDGLVGPADIDANRDGLVTHADAALLAGNAFADVDGDGQVLLDPDLLTIALNLGRTYSPTFVACKVLYSDETSESLDDEIDWSIGGCTKGDLTELKTWLQTFSDGADTVNLVACVIFVGNIVLAIIPPTSPSAAALPFTGAACIATGVAATGIAAAEFLSRDDGANISKVVQGDPDALIEGGFILGVGALDFVGGGAFFKLGKGGIRVAGKLGLKSTKGGVKTSKAFSLEPIEAAIQSKGLRSKLVSALGSEEEAAKLIKHVQELPAKEQARFFGGVSRAIHLQDDRKLFGLDQFLRGTKTKTGRHLVSASRELSVAVGIAQGKRSADEVVVIGSGELEVNIWGMDADSFLTKIWTNNREVDVIELKGASARSVKSAVDLSDTIKRGIFLEDVTKVHEVTRSYADVSQIPLHATDPDGSSIREKAIKLLLEDDLANRDGRLKAKFSSLRNYRHSSSAPELVRTVFFDFNTGRQDGGIGREMVDKIARSAQDVLNHPLYVGADRVTIHLLGEVTIEINAIRLRIILPHVLSIGAEGQAATLRQVWNAGVLWADEMSVYDEDQQPMKLIHGDVPWTDQQSSENQTGSGGGSQSGGQTPPGGTGSGGGSGSGGGGSSGGGSGPGGGSSPAPGPEATADNQCRHEITPDSSVNGEWTASCQSSVPGRGFTRYITFDVPAETEATIDLESDEDPVLYVRQGEVTEGPVLHQNDDRGDGSRNSHVEARLAAGTFTIEATTYSPGVTGIFTLSVTTESTGAQSATTTGCSPVVLTLPAVDVAGTWTDECESSVPGRGYAEYYTVMLTEETEVIVDVESEADPYVYVRGGGITAGQALFENDDRGDGTRHSRVIATLPAGAYVIEASTYSAGVSGNFTLSVTTESTGAQSATTTGCSPVVLTLPAVDVAGTWTDECESSVPGRGYAEYYTVMLTEETEVIVDVESEADPYVYVRGGGITAGQALFENDDRGDGTRHSRVVATLPEGHVTIEVSTFFEGVLGDFKLSFITDGGRAEPSAVTGCGPAALSLPAAGVSGSWGDDCESEEPGRGYSRFYRFTLSEGAEVTIDLQSNEDTYLFLRQGDSIAGETIGENDDVASGDLNSRIVAQLEAGSYVIEASTYAEDTEGYFTLSVGAIAD